MSTRLNQSNAHYAVLNMQCYVIDALKFEIYAVTELLPANSVTEISTVKTSTLRSTSIIVRSSCICRKEEECVTGIVSIRISRQRGKCSIKTVSGNRMENSMRTRLKEDEDDRYLLTDLRIPVRTLYAAIWRW